MPRRIIYRTHIIRRQRRRAATSAGVTVAALLGYGLSTQRASAAILGVTGLSGFEKSISFTRSGMGGATNIAARGFDLIKSSGAILGATPLAARTVSTSFARAVSSGITSLLGFDISTSFARGNVTGATGISGFDLSVSRGTGNPSGIAGLSGLAFSQNFAKLSTQAARALLASAFSMFFNRSTLGGVVGIAGHDTTATQSRNTLSGTTGLSAFSQSQNTARAAFQSLKALLARSVSTIFGRGSPNFNANLNAQVRTLTLSRLDQPTGTVGLSAYTVSAIRALGTLRPVSPLEATRRFVRRLIHIVYNLLLSETRYCIIGQEFQGMPFFGNFPAVASIQKQTLSFEFGDFLPANVTLTGTPTLNITTIFGSDSSPNSHVTSGPIVGSVPKAEGGTGLANTAILFQITGCLAGVTYTAEVSCSRSDGDVVEGSATFQCRSPGT